MQIPRIIFAGVASGVGKTTIVLAVMQALSKKGWKVQPFKVGPDFIDPSYHALVTKRQSRNLDVWMMGERGVKDSFSSACAGADVAVIEGVMGLFDGMSGKDNYASTAHVAKILDCSVILVVDASKSARSIAAIVLGFLHFDKNIRIAGIILNNVASKRHAEYILDALASVIKTPVLGVVHRSSISKMQERHLGLVPAPELQEAKRKEIMAAAKPIGEQIDVDKVLALCSKSKIESTPMSSAIAPKVKIAVALDESFNFYYADNLEALRRCGAELVFFSPVKESGLPENVNGILLGGGFPEVLADKLEQNESMIKSLRKNVQEGVTIYAECGGLMYLTRYIRGYRGENKMRKMAGLIDANTLMTEKLTLNYTEAKCDGPIFGSIHMRGHEFHYSLIENIGSDARFAYTMKRGKGIFASKDGFIINENSLAAYTHLHFSNSRLSQRLVQASAKHSRK